MVVPADLSVCKIHKTDGGPIDSALLKKHQDGTGGGVHSHLVDQGLLITVRESSYYP